MLENGIIEPSCSPFNSNPLLTKKKDGSMRFVIDLRSINLNTIQDTYPLPCVQELIDQTFGCNFFSQLDLASGYWAIPIATSDRAKTEFSVPRGKFQFKRMPFGLKIAQATFQRCMDQIIEACKEKGASGLDAYVDNILIFSKTYEEHIRTLEILLEILEENNMSLRKDKCEFLKESVEFLGFILDGKTLKPSKTNLDKICKFPTPGSRKELQRFLGLANYNRRFIEGYSNILAPLNRLTSSKVDFVWTKEEDAAFEKIKNKFHESLSLHIPDWSTPFVIKTDVSKVAVGSVLGQFQSDGSFKPLGFHSETLNKASASWTATEREMYALVSASRKWKAYCYESITFYTDHEPLRNIRKQKDPRGKIGRWILELENLDYQVKYLKGLDNVEADYLSRIVIEDKQEQGGSPLVYNLTQPFLEKIKEAQLDDQSIKSTIEKVKAGSPVQTGPFRNFANLKISDGVLYKGARIIVPAAATDFVTREFHGQNHFGADNTFLAISARFYWKGMKSQISRFVAECRTCIQCKQGNKPKAPVQDHEDIEKLFEMISLDLGSMPASLSGNNGFLLIVDTFSKLMTAVALPDSKADTIVSSIWSRWFGYYGLPKFLQSDQGQNVDGQKIRKMCEDLAIKKLRSSSYHPAGNGSAERAIGTLKTILRSICLSRNISINRWDEILPEAILHYNTMQNSSSKFSPFEVAYGIQGNTPLDNVLGLKGVREQDPKLIRQNVIANKEEARASYQKQANKECLVNQYQIGDLVLLRRTHGCHPNMSPLYVGPYEIIKQVGPVNWGIVDRESGKTKIVHYDLLQPARKR
jgi:hypothetical protein